MATPIDATVPGEVVQHLTGSGALDDQTGAIADVLVGFKHLSSDDVQAGNVLLAAILVELRGMRAELQALGQSAAQLGELGSQGLMSMIFGSKGG